MQQKKQMKISLKIAILIILIILVIIFGLAFLIYYIQNTSCSSITSTTGLTSTTTIYSDTKKEIPINSNTEFKTYSAIIFDSDLSASPKLDNIFVTSNDELIQYLYKCFGTDTDIYFNFENEEISLKEFFNDEFFQNNNLAIEMYDSSSSRHNYSIVSAIKTDQSVTINIKDNYFTHGRNFSSGAIIVFIAVDKEIESVNFDIYRTTTDNSYADNYELMFKTGIIISIIVTIIISLIISRHNHKINNISNPENESKGHGKAKKYIISVVIALVLVLVIMFSAIVFYEAMIYDIPSIDKPIIYLYPTEETEVTVQLGNNENLTCSYPNYNVNGWNVLAKSNGDLIDLDNGRNLYSLYYESTNVIDFEITGDGFIVKGTDVAEFLEEKLAVLGLTEREAEEFIIYWLPILQENEYNYIRFATMEEISENMPLEITPNPDTIIRILMIYKGLDEPIEVETQELVTPERTGFVVVEWGGTEIK